MAWTSLGWPLIFALKDVFDLWSLLRALLNLRKLTSAKPWSSRVSSLCHALPTSIRSFRWYGLECISALNYFIYITFINKPSLCKHFELCLWYIYIQMAVFQATFWYVGFSFFKWMKWFFISSLLCFEIKLCDLGVQWASLYNTEMCRGMRGGGGMCVCVHICACILHKKICSLISKRFFCSGCFH